jgi:hypothetical protein
MMHDAAADETSGTLLATPATRCVIVLDRELPAGRLANAAAVIALTIGQRHAVLVGEPLIDASGFPHPGLIPMGIAVLGAPKDALLDIRRRGLEVGCDVVDFPADGQTTTDYEAFRRTVARTRPEAMTYLGVALVGQRKDINRIVGNLALVK